MHICIIYIMKKEVQWLQATNPPYAKFSSHSSILGRIKSRNLVTLMMNHVIPHYSITLILIESKQSKWRELNFEPCPFHSIVSFLSIADNDSICQNIRQKRTILPPRNIKLLYDDLLNDILWRNKYKNNTQCVLTLN